MTCILLSLYNPMSFEDYFKQYEAVDSARCGFLLLVVLNPLSSCGLIAHDRRMASLFIGPNNIDPLTVLFHI